MKTRKQQKKWMQIDKDPDTVYSDRQKRHQKRKDRQDLSKIKCYTKREWERMINKFFQMTFSELQEFLDPQRRRAKSCAELLIGSIVAHAIARGDHYKLDFLLARTIGKIIEDQKPNTMEPFIIEQIDGTKMIMGISSREDEEDKQSLSEGDAIDADYVHNS